MDKVIGFLSTVLSIAIPFFKKPTSIVGVESVRSVMVAVDEVALQIVANLKLGAVGEFTAFWDKLQNDADFKAKMNTAWNVYKNIPAEIKDIDLGEGLDLINTEINYVPKFITAIKG
jgi:hypothetical protein